MKYGYQEKYKKICIATPTLIFIGHSEGCGHNDSANKNNKEALKKA
jgi:hypothetical protein